VETQETRVEQHAIGTFSAQGKQSRRKLPKFGDVNYSSPITALQAYAMLI